MHSFIEQVIDEPGNADFILALSLIYDQLLPYRLTESWLSVQLLKLLKKEVSEEKSGIHSYSWVPSPKGIKESVVLRFSLNLRALDRPDFRMALWECLKISRLTWRQVSDCHEGLLFLVWLYFVTEPKTLDDLCSALAVETRPHSMPDNWSYFPLSWGISNAVQTNDGVNLPQYLEAFRSCVPEKTGILVFFLIGRFVGLMSKQNEAQPFPTNLLQAIAVSRSEEVDADWLQLTVKYAGLGDNQDFDLLDKFLETLDTAIPKEWALDESLIANVRSFVLELRDRRDNVLSAT